MNRNKLLVAVLVCSLSSPSFSIPRAPSQIEATYSIGIVRVGALETREEQRGYDLVEKKIERWITRAVPRRARVENLGAVLSPEEMHEKRQRLALEKATRMLVEDLSDTALFHQLTKKRKELENQLSLGPVLQKALLAEAAYLWRREKKARAQDRIKRAQSVHPTNRLAHMPDFGLEGSVSFESQLNRMRQGNRRISGCRYEVGNRLGAPLKLYLNGFPVEGNRFAVPVGKALEMKAVRHGYYAYEKEIKCGRVKKTRLLVKLKPILRNQMAASGEVENLAKQRALRSLLLIEPRDKEFNLYLYTPGLSIDPIPVEKPIRLAELLTRPLQSDIPISSDTIGSLVERHQLVASSLQPDMEPGTVSFENEGDLQYRWYRDWKVWAVAGAVVGGVLAVHLMTNASQVKSQTGGIRIQVK